MKKLGIAGMAALIGAMSASMSRDFYIMDRKPHKPTSKNKPSKNRWRWSEPSEYFGQRSKIVSAQTPKGEQLMKMKTALKGNFPFELP